MYWNGYTRIAEILKGRNATSIIVAAKEAKASPLADYPFPLAFPYRSLEGSFEDRQLYDEQLRVGENMMAFLVSVVLAYVLYKERWLPTNLRGFWREGYIPASGKRSWTSVQRHSSARNRVLPCDHSFALVQREKNKPSKFSQNIQLCFEKLNDKSITEGRVPMVNTERHRRR